MKNRHFVNMLPAFGISPSGDFQFSLSLVGSMTHHVLVQIFFLPWFIFLSFIVQGEISRSETNVFTAFVGSLPDSS